MGHRDNPPSPDPPFRREHVEGGERRFAGRGRPMVTLGRKGSGYFETIWAMPVAGLSLTIWASSATDRERGRLISSAGKITFVREDDQEWCLQILS